MNLFSLIYPLRCLSAGVLLGTAFLGASNLRAQTPAFTFDNLVDLNTSAPGQGSNFTSVGAASLSNGVAVFSGYDGNYAGVFTSSVSTGVSLVVDNTASPTGHGTFSTFNTPTISGNNVTFASNYNAGASGSSGNGIYTASSANPNSASTVVERGQTVPGGTATFTSLNTPVISGNKLVFLGNYTPSGGGYYQGTVGSSALTTLADRTTPAPGQNGATFTNFNQLPTISGAISAFYGRTSSTGVSGIYTSDPANGLRTVADTNTVVPGHGTTTLSGFFGTGVISGNNVAFHATFSGGQGYYLGSVGGAGALSTVVELGQAAPRGGTFTGFGTSPAISGGSVLFDAVTNNNGLSTVGLFLNLNGALTEVINNGDALFGSTLSSFSFAPTAFDGNQIAFNYNLANGDQGVALVTVVPEPSTWVAGVVLMGLAICTHRRRAR